ncbi:MAG: NTP transferase domain-containing protein, partial [Deltaproteobacteria bacterium]|nr:NTP transferase domain-containing protein [Deltaproteobacteria bacterium]
MRAMIVAAGLGTRLRPLTELRPKPALPVRGIPLIAYTLALLARHGVSEVIVNAHHLPDILMDAARRHCPLDMELRFSI